MKEELKNIIEDIPSTNPKITESNNKIVMFITIFLFFTSFLSVVSLILYPSALFIWLVLIILPILAFLGIYSNKKWGYSLTQLVAIFSGLMLFMLFSTMSLSNSYRSEGVGLLLFFLFFGYPAILIMVLIFSIEMSRKLGIQKNN